MITSSSDKPFACNEKNCHMTFVNEDHLNSHKKKHNMSFNLDLTMKNNELVLGDQTPTPTSFFRNCEEVGLFQDLQNVNPFEETFKKALESTDIKTMKLGTLSDVTNEDTLNTPHIFPMVEEPLHNNILDINNSELSIVNLVEIPQISEKIESINEVSNYKGEEKQTYLRNKLKEALMRKDKMNVIKNLENTCSISAANVRTLNCNDNEVEKLKSGKKIDKSHIERIREINRMAQMKCRVKKKRQMDKMVTELLNLKKENETLKKENERLKQSNVHLWKAVEELGGTKDSKMINRMKASLADLDADILPVSPTTLKKLPLIAPANPVLNPKCMPSSTPIIFNLLPVQLLNGTPPPVAPISRQKSTPRILRKT